MPRWKTCITGFTSILSKSYFIIKKLRIFQQSISKELHTSRGFIFFRDKTKFQMFSWHNISLRQLHWWCHFAIGRQLWNGIGWCSWTWHLAVLSLTPVTFVLVLNQQLSSLSCLLFGHVVHRWMIMNWSTWRWTCTLKWIIKTISTLITLINSDTKQSFRILSKHSVSPCSATLSECQTKKMPRRS